MLLNAMLLLIISYCASIIHTGLLADNHTVACIALRTQVAAVMAAAGIH
jgi:hypothetical protein